MIDRPGEDDLHALVDGHLPDDRVRAVQAWLDDHPEDAARVRQWRLQNDALHRLFDPALDEALPPRLHLESVRRDLWARWRGHGMRAVAASVLVVLGVGLGWWWRGQSQPGLTLAREALTAHGVYVVEQRHPVEVPGSERAHMTAWLSKRLGAQMDIPDLGAAGYALVGGRLLPAAEGAAALYMYENAAGQRLTLYVRKAEAERGAPRFQVRDGTVAGVWSQGALGCALTGALPREDMEQLVRRVSAQMGGHKDL